MKKKSISYAVQVILVIVSGIFIACKSEIQPDQIIHIKNFESKYVAARDISIYLPKGYDSSLQYPVIYMHDGQMLFDSTQTWNKQEWKVDETMRQLIDNGTIESAIIVGIASIAELRMAEYFPMAILDSIAQPMQSEIRDSQLKHVPQSDNYLKFIVTELIPHINNKYSIKEGSDHTYLMGSSMGGLISLYGLCQYPEIFGGVACLSTHLPMLASEGIANFESNYAAQQFRQYLEQNLPLENSKKIYFDHGDQTIDAYYLPYQQAVDLIMEQKKWDKQHYISNFYPGTAHSEQAWAARLAVPLSFLLAR